MPGPDLRTDIVEVYVFRRRAIEPSTSRPTNPTSQDSTALQFLQLRRTQPPLSGAWQPVLGHIEPGETASQAALRELAEETGYRPGAGLLNLWQLELVNTYFLASLNRVMLGPGFAAEVAPGIEPTFDAAHDAARWVPRDHADRAFFWPGQRAAVAHIVNDILPADSLAAPALRIPLPNA